MRGLLLVVLVLGARSSVSIEVDTVSDNKDERAMEVERRLSPTDIDDPAVFGARFLRGSYVRFGRSLSTPDRELGDRNDDDKRSSSDEQQKRSKHYVRFGRSSPIDVDEYFYDAAEPGNDDNDDDGLQSLDFVARRSPRRHYVRFGRGRDIGSGRHYVRFGRNGGGGGGAAAVDKRPNRHYVRFGRDESRQQNDSDADKRAHYVRFGRGDELGLHDELADGDGDRPSKADKRPNYVRFG